MNKKELVKLLSYIVMGDGGVYLGVKSKNAYFAMNMVVDNKDFILWCKSIVEEVTSCSISKVDKGENRRLQYTIRSKSHPLFTTLRDRIYVDKYKSIDVHALKLLDFEALAILYMCDGSLHSYKRENIGMKKFSHDVTLNLKRLSYGDLFLLKKALKDKLDLEWNINKQGKYFYLRLRSKDIDKFMAGISKYVFNSFGYKVLNGYPLRGGEIVCPSQRCEELSRNDLAPQNIEE